MNTKELEKTRQLLLEAKQSCPIDAISSKIQQTIQELEATIQHMTGISSPTSSQANNGNTSHITTTTLTPTSSFSANGSHSGTNNGSGIVRRSINLGELATLVDEPDMLSGDLWKRGSRLRQMIKRHYVLQGTFLYYYAYVHTSRESCVCS